MVQKFRRFFWMALKTPCKNNIQNYPSLNSLANAKFLFTINGIGSLLDRKSPEITSTKMPKFWTSEICFAFGWIFTYPFRRQFLTKTGWSCWVLMCPWTPATFTRDFRGHSITNPNYQKHLLLLCSPPKCVIFWSLAFFRNRSTAKMIESGLGQDCDAAQRWNLLRFFLQNTTHLAAAVDMTGGRDGF